LGSGPRGRRFKSFHPDLYKTRRKPGLRTRLLPSLRRAPILGQILRHFFSGIITEPRWEKKNPRSTWSDKAGRSGNRHRAATGAELGEDASELCDELRQCPCTRRADRL